MKCRSQPVDQHGRLLTMDGQPPVHRVDPAEVGQSGATGVNRTLQSDLPAMPTLALQPRGGLILLRPIRRMPLEALRRAWEKERISRRATRGPRLPTFAGET